LNNLTVIVTACGAPGGVPIIKLLREVDERKIRIVGVDMRETASGFLLADESYIVPHGGSEEYVNAMVDIADETGADVVLPLSSHELLALANNMNKFSAKIVVNDADALRVALNKRKTYEYLSRKTRLDVPRFGVACNFEAFKETAKWVGYPDNPTCFKPSVASGQRGFVVLDENSHGDSVLKSKPRQYMSRASLETAHMMLGETFPEIVVMEYLGGDEYSVDSLVKDGETLVAVPRRRVEINAGITRVGVVEQNEEVMEYARAVNSAFGFNYNINVQLKYDSEECPKLLEINPRVSGTICLSSKAGPNLPYLAIKQVLDESFTVPSIKWGLRMVRCWNEMYY